jgi:hypothetical protein
MNYGKKVEGIEFITRPSQVLGVLNKINSGRLFRVDFLKKGDGTMRTVVGRRGVTIGVKGTGKKYKGSELIKVYESGGGWKQFSIDMVKTIKADAILYKFDLINPSLGKHRDIDTKIVGRTVPAYTSPMY